jgi:hypothetical protein
MNSKTNGRCLVRLLERFDSKLAGTRGAGVECGRMRPEEVSVRPVSVFVRALAPLEGQRLKRLSKRAKHESTRQRAMILLASATLMSPAEIADMLLTDESHVRKVIHDFNERGFDSLRPRYGGGDPAGSRVTTSSGSSRSPAPVPRASGCPSPVGASPSCPSTCVGRGSPSRPRISRGCSPGPGSRSSAAAPGRRAPIPSTKRRPRGCSRCTGSSRRAGW